MAAAATRMKIKSPFYAIPQPGRRPFVCERSRYETVINKLDRFQQDIREDGHLEVVGHAGKVKCRYVFFDLWRVNEYRVKRSLIDWAERMDKLRNPAKAQAQVAQNKYEKQIAKLERALVKLDHWRNGCGTKAPHNPILNWRDADSLRYYNPELAQWARGKQLRKRLAAVAGQVLEGNITTVQGYKQVRTFAIGLRTESQLLKHEQCSHQDYWRNLWKFVQGTGSHGYRTPSKPWSRRPEDWNKQMEAHAKAIQEWLGNIREAKALRSQIEAIKQLAVS